MSKAEGTALLKINGMKKPVIISELLMIVLTVKLTLHYIKMMMF